MAKVLAIQIGQDQRIKFTKHADDGYGNPYICMQNEILTNGKWEIWPVITAATVPINRINLFYKAVRAALELDITQEVETPTISEAVSSILTPASVSTNAIGKQIEEIQVEKPMVKRYIITVADTEDQFEPAILKNRNSPAMDFGTRDEALSTEGWPEGASLNVVRFQGDEIQNYRILYSWTDAGWVK